MACFLPQPVQRTECRWSLNLASHLTFWLVSSSSEYFSFRSESNSKASISATLKHSRRTDLELLLVLGLPLLGAILLALVGHRRYAAELNVGVSLLTFAAAALLVLRVFRHGPMLAWREQMLVDSFNVFLVALTA